MTTANALFVFTWCDSHSDSIVISAQRSKRLCWILYIIVRSVARHAMEAAGKQTKRRTIPWNFLSQWGKQRSRVQVLSRISNIWFSIIFLGFHLTAHTKPNQAFAVCYSLIIGYDPLPDPTDRTPLPTYSDSTDHTTYPTNHSPCKNPNIDSLYVRHAISSGWVLLLRRWRHPGFFSKTRRLVIGKKTRSALNHC